MVDSRSFALILTCASLALPSAALAASAGDDQYIDPLAGLDGSDGTTSPTTTRKPKTPSTGSTTDGSSVPSASTPAAVDAAPSATAAKPRVTARRRSQAVRPALDVSQLSGIGPLVAVPLSHVTLVLGDIANGRA